ncbi:GLPGLI family protein [Dokdonia sp. R86516]|uniref:GLPGLI family protein n=1 Tax=Dokdonia sp. R86516 TaxID=3093856 RepID=UPI0037CC7A18
MKKTLLLLILISSVHLASSQNAQTGIIYYDHIDNHYDESYNAYLVFEPTTAHFVTAKDSLGLSNNTVNVNNGNGDQLIVEAVNFSDVQKTRKQGLQVYMNKRTDSMYSSNAFSLTAGLLYTKESLPKLQWQLSNDTKQIGKFQCLKATTTFRGRTYTCWYTTQIPLPYGPWKLQGLPGMILEASSNDRFVQFIFKGIEFPVQHVQVPSTHKILLTKEQDFISFTQYKKLQKEDIQAYDNAMKVQGKKFGITVHPFSERDNYLEVFGDQ